MSGFRLRPDGKLHVSENDVERNCLQVLGLRHLFVRRQHVGNFLPARDVLRLVCPTCRAALRRAHWITMGETGDPDYAVIAPPSFFVEVKRPGESPSAEQRERIFRLEKFFNLKTLVVGNVDEDIRQLADYIERFVRSP